MECSLSAFCYEHLVTTFTRLNIACGILYGKDSRNRSRQTQPVETLDLWKPKQGLSLIRMVIYEDCTVYCIYKSEFVKICVVSISTQHYKPISPLELQFPAKQYILTSTNTFQTVIGFQTTSYMSLNSSKSKTHDKKIDP